MKDKEIDIFFPEVKPDFLSPTLERPYVLRRMDKGSDRYYHTMSDGKITGSYISNTSLSSKVIPKGVGLERWRDNLGIEEADRQMKIRASYGTAFHVLALKIFHNKGYFSFREMEKEYLDLFPAYAQDYAMENIESMKRDLLCFFLFVKERVVDVLAIEIPLRSKRWGVAGTLDLVADIKFNGKTIRAIIDLKSGRNGFYKPHHLQLKMCKAEWEESFPDYPIDGLFNLSPVDYRKNVKYNLTNQTNELMGLAKFGDIEIREWELLLLLAQAQDLIRPPKKYELIWGEVKDVKTFNPEDNSLVFNL